MLRYAVVTKLIYIKILPTFSRKNLLLICKNNYFNRKIDCFIFYFARVPAGKSSGLVICLIFALCQGTLKKGNAASSSVYWKRNCVESLNLDYYTVLSTSPCK